MKKLKYLTMALFIGIALFLMPNFSNAAVGVTKDIYANNGSAKYKFTGLKLDKTHDYEFGFTKTANTKVEKWYLITENTETTATVDISGANREFTDVIVATDTGYITIKDKTTDTIILNPYAIDLTVSYLNLTNYTVINNGKEWKTDENDGIQINFWNASNSKPYYQYEKITDEKIINKYKEIKSKNGNYNDLQPLLKKKAPTSNWKAWSYWNGHGDSNDIGFGYVQSKVEVPDYGLYYMWIYLAGSNVKNAYGYILVDNLQPEIVLDRISLPETVNVELGKTLTLVPTFSPNNTTNKIVTWNSSDESVATVDNAGKITPKKIGSTIITVTSQGTNKRATCTVTITGANNNQGGTSNTGTNSSDKGNSNTNGTTPNNGANANGNTGSNQGTTDNNKTPTNTNNNNKPQNNANATQNSDNSTQAKGKLPQTGVGIGTTVAIIAILSVGIFLFFKYNGLRDIK